MSRVSRSAGNSRSGCSAKDDGETVMDDASNRAQSQAKLGLDIPANWPNGQVVRPIVRDQESRPLELASITRGDVMRPMGRLRWKMLALMLCGTIVIYVDRNVLGVLAPILKKDLNFSTEQYSYVVSAFQLVYSFSQPVAGYLTDLIGPRLGYAVAALIWGVAAALHGLATGWVSMAAFRALLGLSEAVAIPTGTKVSTIWFPTKERSIATGWFNSGS